MRKPVRNFSDLAVTCAIVAALIGVTLALNAAAPSDGASQSNTKMLANGSGKTMVQGGTGGSIVGSYPTYTPILTTLAFQAAKTGGAVAGSLDCLALAPESAAGSFTSESALFTVNAMYVTGQVSGAVVAGDRATLTGTATVTGLGAGTNLPFTLVVKRGGPGATAVLSVSGFTFNEVLLEGGSFNVGSD